MVLSCSTQLASGIGPDQAFLEIGFSSFTALEARNRLCDLTGLLLSPVIIVRVPDAARPWSGTCVRSSAW